jgi:ubiquinone/menaquinone biosynthesis C-methylase UbiE
MAQIDAAPSNANPPHAAPNLEAVKAKQQITWSTGNYSRVGSLLQISGERLAEAMDARPGADFLDVAAGNGNLTMAAARRFCRVVSTDYVEASLNDGAERARANGLEVEFRVADAEALPFDDASFDFVGSTFGVMFTANQEKAAAELLRVCRAGGKIGMANWTPAGFIGKLFKVIGQFNPPPAGVQSPARWGTEAFLREQFGPSAADLHVERRDYVFRFESTDHFMTVFKSFYGPIITALEAQTEENRPKLEQAIADLVDSCNVATDGTLLIPGEYLEIVVTKQ